MTLIIGLRRRSGHRKGRISIWYTQYPYFTSPEKNAMYPLISLEYSTNNPVSSGIFGIPYTLEALIRARVRKMLPAACFKSVYIVRRNKSDVASSFFINSLALFCFFFASSPVSHIVHPTTFPIIDVRAMLSVCYHFSQNECASCAFGAIFPSLLRVSAAFISCIPNILCSV